jgi:flagellar motor protein MotB
MATNDENDAAAAGKITGPITLKSNEFFMQQTSKQLEAYAHMEGAETKKRVPLAIAGALAIVFAIIALVMTVRMVHANDELSKAKNEINGLTNTATTQAQRITAFEGAQTQQANEVIAKANEEALAQKAARDLAAKITAEMPVEITDTGGIAIGTDGRRAKIELRDELLFDGPKMELSDMAKQAIAKIAQTIRKSEGAVEVVGHIDPRRARASAEQSDGTWGLSSARAALVVRALEDGRVSNKRLTLTSKGSAAPLGGNGSPKGRAKNRRVEIFIVP